FQIMFHLAKIEITTTPDRERIPIKMADAATRAKAVLSAAMITTSMKATSVEKNTGTGEAIETTMETAVTITTVMGMEVIEATTATEGMEMAEVTVTAAVIGTITATAVMAIAAGTIRTVVTRLSAILKIVL
ncbi:MAG: hypothetical protein HUK22_07870, partial [Thermoguttaceae bacterium]|nr:hypothetical protein [Thermoguttaceae bacterium]